MTIVNPITKHAESTPEEANNILTPIDNQYDTTRPDKDQDSDNESDDEVPPEFPYGFRGKQVLGAAGGGSKANTRPPKVKTEDVKKAEEEKAEAEDDTK